MDDWFILYFVALVLSNLNAAFDFVDHNTVVLLICQIAVLLFD